MPGQALGHRALVQEQVVAAVLQGVGVVPEVAGHRAVRVEVDNDHALAGLGQQAGQGDGSGGLADPAFLIGYCPDSHQANSIY
ncbi:hypothetical protein D3C75_1025240 [compost metagenome]